MSLKIKNNKKIAFLGLAQNCGKTLKKFFYFIDKIQNDFKKIYLFIGENESTDNTLEILKNYKNRKIQIKIINTSFLKKYSYRLEKMARARNYLAKFIKKINLDYVVCVDLDDVISNGINKKEFLNSLQILDKRNDLFGISATSKPYYYDIAGLRIKNYFMKNIYHISKVRKIFKGYILRKKYIYDVQKKINGVKKLSISSFNGLCIYKHKYYKQSEYFKKNENLKKFREQCEHITFNQTIHKKNKKHILINKNLVLNMPDEHKPYSTFLSFLVGKILLFVKKI